MNRKNRERKQKRSQKKTNIMRDLSVTYTGPMPFWDYQITTSASTTPTSLFLLDPLLSSTGLFANYPQSVGGYFNGTTFRLRGTVIIRRIEMRIWITGAQSTVLLPGDLYNTVRLGFYLAGAAYTDSTEQYLGNGYSSGTDTDDVNRVYYDKSFPLSSTMYDSANLYNTPATRVVSKEMDCSETLKVYSTTPSGAGGTWNTVRNKFLCDIVSDSSVAPHPEVRVSFRFFFTLKR
jgi:hypothetical protein